MLRVHLSDGETQSYDLEDADVLESWKYLVAQDAFQKQITGMSVASNGSLHALPQPRRFRRRTFGAEPLNGKGPGVRLWCQADDVRVILTAHGTPLSVRVDLQRTGEPRHLRRS